MFEIFNNTSTVYANNAPIDFNTVKFTDCRIHNEGGTSFSIKHSGRYYVEMSGVGSSNTALSPFTVQLFHNGVALPEAVSTVTSTAAGDMQTMHISTIINVSPSCCAVDNTANLQFRVTSTAAGTMTDATLIIYKLR